MEVHSNGFCFNSEPYNKNASELLCDRKPTSSNYLLNYNYGFLN